MGYYDRKMLLSSVTQHEVTFVSDLDYARNQVTLVIPRQVWENIGGPLDITLGVSA